MPPSGEDLEKKVEDAPSIGDHIAYDAPVQIGGLAVGLPLGYLAYNYIKNITYNAIGNISSSIAGGVAAGFFGIAGYALSMRAVAGVMGLVSKGARKYFGIGKLAPAEVKATGPPMR